MVGAGRRGIKLLYIFYRGGGGYQLIKFSVSLNIIGIQSIPLSLKAESEFGDPLNPYLVHDPVIVLQRLLGNVVSLVNMSKMYKQIGGFFWEK